MKSFVINAPKLRPALTLSSALLLLSCTEAGDAPGGEAQRDESSLTAMELGESSIRFSMNKWGDTTGATKVAVTGSFRTFAVRASSQAQSAQTLEELEGLSASITIDLTSLDTGMEPRNANITQHYFEAAAFPSAVFTLSNLRAQDQGEAGLVLADGELDLHGFTQRFSDIALHVSRDAHSWTVESSAPIEVRSADFGLPAAALISVCGHPGLDEAATVEVELHLVHGAD